MLQKFVFHVYSCLDDKNRASDSVLLCPQAKHFNHLNSHLLILIRVGYRSFFHVGRISFLIDENPENGRKITNKSLGKTWEKAPSPHVNTPLYAPDSNYAIGMGGNHHHKIVNISRAMDFWKFKIHKKQVLNSNCNMDGRTEDGQG